MKNFILAICLFPTLCAAELKPDDFQSRAAAKAVKSYLLAKTKAEQEFEEARTDAEEKYQESESQARKELIEDFNSALKREIANEHLEEALKIQKAMKELQASNSDIPNEQRQVFGVWKAKWFNHPEKFYQEFGPSGENIVTERRVSPDGEIVDRGQIRNINGKMAYLYVNGTRIIIWFFSDYRG
ncbi:MAG: hypothetical protein HUJ26_05005 [Planctomycetaceae bacterium]|nr:hypothetical protein [Planctomycetaceae bacterium]